MSTISPIARLLVLFVAVAGFLFGQLFNGVFSLGGMLAGIGGALAAGLAGREHRPDAMRLVRLGSALGLTGAALHVYEYYSTSQIRGNYYPWFLTLPFAIGLLVLAHQTRRSVAIPGR